MNSGISLLSLEKLEEFVFELEEAEGSLSLLADLCAQATEPQFCSQETLLEISKVLRWYLDKSRSARHYFLRREKQSFEGDFGVLGELRRLEEKYRD